MNLVALLLFICILSVAINLFFWMGWTIISTKNDKTDKASVTKRSRGVSIVICAKNEIVSLQRNLKSIIEQKYPLFEIIIVDDDSSDDSLNWLNQLASLHSNLNILTCHKTLPGKKQALKLGVDRAKFEWILLTDADCQAVSTSWIEEMMNARSVTTKIVLGYSPYKRRNSWLNKMIRYETTMTALQYFSAVSFGIPYMGVGRNILYHRSGFKKYDDVIQFDIPSGDDDLLVNAIANRDNVAACLTPNSHIITEPETTWQSFILQKTRHVSTSYSYKLHHKIMLIGFAASQVGTLLVFVLFFTNYWCIGLFALFVRLLVILLRSKYLFKHLEVEDLWISIPILDVGLSLYYLLIHPLGVIFNWGKNSKFVR